MVEIKDSNFFNPLSDNDKRGSKRKPPRRHIDGSPWGGKLKFPHEEPLPGRIPERRDGDTSKKPSPLEEPIQIPSKN